MFNIITFCESRNHINEDENDSSISEVEQETEDLKEVVKSLNQLNEIEQKLVSSENINKYLVELMTFAKQQKNKT